MKTSPWLIIGGDSKIGQAFIRHLSAKGIAWVASSRRSARVSEQIFFLDLSADDFILPPGPFAGVLFCAGMSRISDCEKNPAQCMDINVTASLRLCKMLVPAPIIYLSTNLVFDGRTDAPEPKMATSAATAYGRSKAAFEQQFLTAKLGIILRLTKVLFDDDTLLLDWLQRLQAGENVDAFSDYPVAPLTMSHLADTIEKLLSLGLPGLFHLSGAKDLSYRALALQLALHAGLDPGRVNATSARPLIEHLPYHSRLGMIDTTARTEIQPFDGLELYLENFVTLNSKTRPAK